MTLPLAKAFAQVIQVRMTSASLAALLTTASDHVCILDVQPLGNAEQTSATPVNGMFWFPTFGSLTTVDLLRLGLLGLCLCRQRLPPVSNSVTQATFLSRQHTLADCPGPLHADGVGVSPDPGVSEDDHGAAEHAAALHRAFRCAFSAGTPSEAPSACNTRVVRLISARCVDWNPADGASESDIDPMIASTQYSL